MYKNSSNLNLTLTVDQMLMSNIHIGHTKKFLNVKVKPYLLGSRNNIYILNILNTSSQFKTFINLIINLVSLRHRILVVKDRDLFNFRHMLKLNNIYFYDQK